MTTIFINTEVVSGDVQVSSDAFAAGFDSIVMAFHTKVRWTTHVEVHGERLDCRVEMQGTDEDDTARRIVRMFSYAYSEKNIETGVTETRN